jgi:hypothetical protein
MVKRSVVTSDVLGDEGGPPKWRSLAVSTNVARPLSGNTAQSLSELDAYKVVVQIVNNLNITTKIVTYYLAYQYQHRDGLEEDEFSCNTWIYRS